VSGKRILHRDHESAVVGEDGRYRLIRLIGEDGLGQLWQGEDAPLQAPVTIRIVRESLTRDQARVDASHQQLNALYPRLAHPNIASVYYYNNGQDGPVEFVVMEELGGQTLAHRLERGAELRPREGFAIGAEIAEGLQAAHDLGFAHAALTSHSVMLNDDRPVKIMDFGLAALLPNAKERLGSEGPADDVLALGALLREMSGSRSGGRPVGDPASGKTIGAELARLWRASLDPDPATRPTAEAFAWALREVAEPRPGRDVRPVEGADTALRLDEADRLKGEEEVRQAEEARKAEEVRHEEERRALLEAQATETRRAEEPRRKTEEARKAEERRALLEAQATETRRAEEAQRKAAEARKTEERRALLEAQATEARRAEAAQRKAEEARKAQEVAEAEQAKLSQEAARAREVARQEEKVRTDLVRRAENAARQAETARAAAAATRARKTKADEEARSAGEAARAEEARRAYLARRAKEAARKKDEQAKVASGPVEGLPRDDALSTPGRSSGDARSVARSRSRPGSDAPPSALPKRAERSWSAVGLLPRDRRWLWLAGPVMVTAFLVILFARPDAERAGNQTPPTAPQEETDSAGIVVPDLRGLSYTEALSRLQEEGLLLARRVEAQGDPGVVIATDPSLGHLVSTGTRVTIFVGAAQTPSDEEATASV
jgi:Protein kinase domain/PASTA domain